MSDYLIHYATLYKYIYILAIDSRETIALTCSSCNIKYSFKTIEPGSMFCFYGVRSCRVLQNKSVVVVRKNTGTRDAT